MSAATSEKVQADVRFVVEVNEAKIFTFGGHRDGAPEWWAIHSGRPGIEARTTVLIHSIPGRLLYLDCEGREEAEFVRDYAIGKGLHRGCMRIVRIGYLTACGRCGERRRFWARTQKIAWCRSCFDRWVADGCSNITAGGAP